MSVLSSAVNAAGLTLTPGGYRPASDVFQIEAGYHLSARNGNFFKVRTALDQEMLNLGPVSYSENPDPSLPQNISGLAELASLGGLSFPPLAPPDPGHPDGWVAFTSWPNTTGRPITLFTAQWTVPPPPTSVQDQTIFIFLSMQNNSYILQPVLQWGHSAAGGGPAWNITNWYVGIKGPAYHKDLVEVQPGTVLRASIRLLIRQDGGLTYTSSFEGFPSIDMVRTDVQELKWLNLALETYEASDCGNYPPDTGTTFTGVTARIQAGVPNIVWTAHKDPNSCGIDCIVNPNRSVQIQY